jgi:succinate-semialdehyde dehydrogenase/glutarate-semialdehyde dehydrogenase
MAIESIDPATGKRLRSFEALDDAALEEKLARAAAAFRSWGRVPVRERTGVLTRLAELLVREKASLGQLMTQEMGKLIGAAEQEAEKCALACRYYADNAERFLAPEVTGDGDGRDRILYQPLGPVLAVMPWNFPFWQVMRFAAPAVAAGNVGLLKHASNVPGCALAIEDLFLRAGAPPGVFQTLLIGSDRVRRVIADERVAAVTVTGSEGAGREIASAAGRHIKKTVLELGGSDPFLVLPSADMAAAVETAVRARIVNNGQSCIAAKRVIAVGAAYDRFAPRFVDAMHALVVGDPMSRETQVGPLATAAILETLADQVDRSVAAGARVLAGGMRLHGVGNYYAPTVLADVPPTAPAYHEELFGPVATLLHARDLEEGIAMANATSFGLGASAWTRDRTEVERLARDIEAGSVFINGMVASDPRFPFGGVKHSGYGRELGLHGLREFVNVKTVRIAGL